MATDSSSDADNPQILGDIDDTDAVWKSMKILADAHLLARQNILHQDRLRRNAEHQSSVYRDLICSLQRRVKTLENIKRVSQEYIHGQKQLLDAMERGEQAQRDILRHSLDELDKELSLWQDQLKEEQSLNFSLSLLQLSTSNSTASDNQINSQQLPSNTCDKTLFKPHPIIGANLKVASLTQPSDDCVSSMEVDNGGSNTLVNCLQLSSGDLETSNIDDNNELQYSSPLAELESTLLENLEIKNENSSVKNDKYKQQCNFEGCDYRCRTKSQLKTHEFKHSGTSQFICDINGCPYTTNYKNNLKKHQASHRDKPELVIIPAKKSTAIKKATCTISASEYRCTLRDCTFVSRSKKSWQNHHRKHVKPLLSNSTNTDHNLSELPQSQ